MVVAHGGRKFHGLTGAVGTDAIDDMTAVTGRRIAHGRRRGVAVGRPVIVISGGRDRAEGQKPEHGAKQHLSRPVMVVIAIMAVVAAAMMRPAVVVAPPAIAVMMRPVIADTRARIAPVSS